MSIEETLEQRAFDVLAEIYKIPRPTERKRICAEIIRLASIVGQISPTPSPDE